MSSVGELLVTALSAIAGGRICPGIAEEGTAKPYLTYQHDGNVARTLDGRSNLQQQAVQIDVWDETYLGARAVADQVISAMEGERLYGSPGTFRAGLDRDSYFGPDPNTRAHRFMLEFTVWINVS